jgi:transposase-like protein
MNKPNTLQQAVQYFKDEQTCIDTVASLRWPNGPVCPRCEHKEHYYLATQKRWKCKKCGKQFSVKQGTIFEDSPIGLDKWLVAIWMVANCKNGISSYEVHRAIGVTQKSAWFMLHRIRLAMQTNSLVKLGGPGSEVEVDETYIGGRSRNMHKEVRKRRIKMNGPGDKTAVLGMIERGGVVRALVAPNVRKTHLQGEVRKHVDAGSTVYTDALLSYKGLDGDYIHKTIDHAVKYVSGAVHTNTLENYWSLLKRGLKGTYISVEPFHLFRYLDEQSFRYNHRIDENGKKRPDGERFDILLSQIAGKRLTFAEATGKVGETAAN